MIRLEILPRENFTDYHAHLEGTFPLCAHGYTAEVALQNLLKVLEERIQLCAQHPDSAYHIAQGDYLRTFAEVL